MLNANACRGKDGMCHCEDSEHGEEDEAISLKLGDSHKPPAMTAKVFVSAWRKGFFLFQSAI